MAILHLSALSEPEVAQIHEQSLAVLETIGCAIGHPETLRRFRRAGARVDEECGRVRIPAGLVGELLRQAPPVALETGLNGRVLEAGGDNRYYCSLILDPFVVDYREGIRPPRLEDVRRNTIVGESLPRVSSMMRMQQPVSDVPEPDCYLKTMEVFLSMTTKHIPVYPVSERNCREWMDAAAVIAEAAGLDADRTPLLSVAMAVTSPLQIHGPNIEMMKMAMERSYPVVSTVCPMAGTTAPYSVAGTFLQANVEALLPVLVTQLYKPGHPAFYGIGPSVTDMRSGRDLYYRAEKTLFKIMAGRMGRFYNLPTCGEAGGTLTHRADVQNGAESMLYLLASLCGRQNIVGGLGSLGNANGMSSEQIVMQCGLADMAEYLARGVEVSPRKLAFASLEAQGPGGNFLADPLTLELLRDAGEFFHSPYLDLSGGYEPGAPGMYEKAHVTVEELVRGFRNRVPGRVREAVERFFHPRYRDRAVARL